MENSGTSKLFYPSKMGRLFLLALQESLGHTAFKALLNHTGRSHFIADLPADTLQRDFDFAHIACLNQGLEALYGPRGARGLALRSGRFFFQRGLQEFGILVGLGDLTLRALPLQTKARMGLVALARIFSQFSDQESYNEELGPHFLYHVVQCPICWGRTAGAPIDHFHVGFLQQAMRWVGRERDFRVVQTQCTAMGDSHCVFRVDKEPLR